MQQIWRVFLLQNEIVKEPKIAIVHDWLVTIGGAELVLAKMLTCFPQAELFSIIDFIPDDQRCFIRNKKARTSFIQKFPWAKSNYRNYLPLMPLAIEQFDLSDFDIIISSSHAVAKGVLTGPDQIHICMCYSPMRYAWDLQFQYLKQSGLQSGFKSYIARVILHKMRIWDSRTASGVDYFIAISQYIKRRIKKVYGRDSMVIYPPVEVEDFKFNPEKGDYYLTVSRMVPYKNVPLIVEAFSRMPDKKLMVIGDGPDFKKCSQFTAPNITLAGWKSRDFVVEQMQTAKAFVFDAEEDFGIAPLEAQACGTPVIAFGKGGATETIIVDDQASDTGLFFYEQSCQSIIDAVNRFEEPDRNFNPVNCRENALRFSNEVFVEKFSKLVVETYKSVTPTKVGLGSFK